MASSETLMLTNSHGYMQCCGGVTLLFLNLNNDECSFPIFHHDPITLISITPSTTSISPHQPLKISLLNLSNSWRSQPISDGNFQEFLTRHMLDVHGDFECEFYF